MLQAEVIAITETLTWTKMNLDEGTRISVRSDSQAAIQAITGRTVSTKTVSECQMVLASVKETMQVRIDWIKGHADHPGNEAADALAKEANKLARDLHGPLPLAAIPLTEVRQRIKNWRWKQWQNCWQQSDTCKQTRIFFPEIFEAGLLYTSPSPRDS